MKPERCISVVLIATVLISACAMFAPVDARFRGGSIKDIQNRIKQAIETAKQSEIYTQYKEMTEFKKEATKAWEKLDKAVDRLTNDIDKSFVKNPKSTLLKAGSESEFRREIRKRSQFDFSKYGNTPKGRKENMKTLMDYHQTAFMETAETANDNSTASDDLYENVTEIAEGLTDGSNYSVRQKQAILAAQEARSRNIRAATETQLSAMELELALMRENIEMESSAANAEQAMSVPRPDDEYYLNRVKESRLEGLPK